MIRKKRFSQGLMRRNLRAQNKNATIERSKLKMQVNLTQEGSTSRNHSKESSYPEIIFSTNPTSPFINDSYDHTMKRNMYDVHSLKSQIKDLKLQNTLTAASIADLKIDNELLRKELNRFQQHNQFQTQEEVQPLFLPSPNVHNSVENMTIDSSRLPSSRQLMYNQSNLVLGPLSPRLIDKRNIKFKSKDSNIEQKLANFEHRKVHFENSDGALNLTERNRNTIDLSTIVKEQALTISNLKNRIRELEEEVVTQQTLIKQQEEKIATNNQQIKVQRLRDDLEIAHIIPRLRLCLQVFENNLQEYLFESKTTMTKDEFLATMIDKLHIEKNEDALLLANYFIPNGPESIKTWKVLEKIIQISGPYRSFKDSDFIKLKETFENVEEQKKKQFIKRLSLLINNKADHMTSKNFTLFLQTTDIEFDIRAFIVLLLRKSQSISLISVFALKQVMYEILGFGTKPEKEDPEQDIEMNEELSQTAFADNIKKIMLTYKVAQAFKAMQHKPKLKAKNNKMAKRTKTYIMKTIKSGIKDKIKKFIRGDPLSDEEKESTDILLTKETNDLGVKTEDVEIAKNFFIKIADYCLTSNFVTGTQQSVSLDSSISKDKSIKLCLTDLIRDCLYDFTVEGIEHEVISIKDFFECLEKQGIKCEDDHQREIIERILRLTSTDPNWLLVSNLTTILKTFGVKEDLPDDNKFIKFSYLKGKDIRIINRLIYYLEKSNTKDVKVFLAKITFKQRVVSLKNSSKEQVIELCKTEDFFQALRKRNISKGIELEENLLLTLCLSPEKLDLIMINKLVKMITYFKSSRYFQKFGIQARLFKLPTQNSIVTKDTVTKDELMKTKSRASANFSEVDLTDDELFTRSSRKVPKKHKRDQVTG